MSWRSKSRSSKYAVSDFDVGFEEDEFNANSFDHQSFSRISNKQASPSPYRPSQTVYNGYNGRQSTLSYASAHTNTTNTSSASSVGFLTPEEERIYLELSQVAQKQQKQLQKMAERKRELTKQLAALKSHQVDSEGRELEHMLSIIQQQLERQNQLEEQRKREQEEQKRQERQREREELELAALRNQSSNTELNQQMQLILMENLQMQSTLLRNTVNGNLSHGKRGDKHKRRPGTSAKRAPEKTNAQVKLPERRNSVDLLFDKLGLQDGDDEISLDDLTDDDDDDEDDDYSWDSYSDDGYNRRRNRPHNPEMERRWRVALIVTRFIAHMQMRGKAFRNQVAVQKKSMQEDIEFNMKIATKWARKAIKASVSRVVEDKKLNLEIVKPGKFRLLKGGVSPNEVKQRVKSTQVRAKMIVGALVDAVETMPDPLLKFFLRFTSNSQTMPEAYPFRKEGKALHLNHRNMLLHMNDHKRRMLIGNFILTRVLILDILLDPERAGLTFKVKLTAKAKKNLQTIASLIYLMTRMTISDMLDRHGQFEQDSDDEDFSDDEQDEDSDDDTGYDVSDSEDELESSSSSKSKKKKAKKSSQSSDRKEITTNDKHLISSEPFVLNQLIPKESGRILMANTKQEYLDEVCVDLLGFLNRILIRTEDFGQSAEFKFRREFSVGGLAKAKSFALKLKQKSNASSARSSNDSEDYHSDDDIDEGDSQDDT